MENFLCAACCCLEAGSGNWIMADFRDGKATMENFLVHPGLGLQEDRTKKGRNSANGQWAMEWRSVPAAQVTWARKGEMTTDGEWGWAMDNGEGSPPDAHPARARPPGILSNGARFANRWRRWSEPRNQQRCGVTSGRGARP